MITLDKQTISIFGFTIISVILFLMIFPMVTPIGQSVKEKIDINSSELLNSVQTFTEKNAENEENNFCTLTIKYKLPNGELYKQYKASYKIGEKYYIVSPEFKGYKPSKEFVSGVIQDNTYYEIQYTIE